MTRSLSIVLPAAMGHDANTMLEAVGMGRPFVVLLYAESRLMVGLHAYEDDPTRYTDPPAPSGGWEAYGLTPHRVGDILGAMVVADHPDDGTPSRDRFVGLAASQGVAWGGAFPALPAAGSGALVTAGEFYRASPGQVVRVVQTHQRHDPSHTDLKALAALFQVIDDPLMPHPWRQPQGAHDAYPLVSVIGGPVRVTHNGRLWRNAVEANVWAPGVAGWIEEGPA